MKGRPVRLTDRQFPQTGAFQVPTPDTKRSASGSHRIPAVTGFMLPVIPSKARLFLTFDGRTRPHCCPNRGRYSSESSRPRALINQSGSTRSKRMTWCHQQSASHHATQDRNTRDTLGSIGNEFALGDLVDGSMFLPNDHALRRKEVGLPCTLPGTIEAFPAIRSGKRSMARHCSPPASIFKTQKRWNRNSDVSQWGTRPGL